MKDADVLFERGRPFVLKMRTIPLKDADELVLLFTATTKEKVPIAGTIGTFEQPKGCKKTGF